MSPRTELKIGLTVAACIILGVVATLLVSAAIAQRPESTIETTWTVRVSWDARPSVDGHYVYWSEDGVTWDKVNKVAAEIACDETTCTATIPDSFEDKETLYYSVTNYVLYGTQTRESQIGVAVALPPTTGVHRIDTRTTVVSELEGRRE